MDIIMNPASDSSIEMPAAKQSARNKVHTERPTMFNKGFTSITLGVACAAITIATASTTDITNAAGHATSVSTVEAMSNFKELNINSAISKRTNGSISRIYGQAFSSGSTAQISTQSFINLHADMWGVSATELVAEGPFADGHHTQPIGYEPQSDSYKFTGHYYTQYSNGIKVFRSKLVLLTRNEENNPLVLASSQLHDLQGFQVDNQIARAPVNVGLIVANVKAAYNSPLASIISTERVIFAGLDSESHQPTLVDASTMLVDGFEKHIVLTDAATGEIIYQENLIHTIDVSGNASAFASSGPGPDICEEEIARPLPYLEVAGPGITVLTDVDGNFTMPNAGTNNITLATGLRGQWFEVSDFLTSVTSDIISVAPPGPANLFLNPTNSDEMIRAQVNAYIEANVVRDFAIAANPAYPTLMNEQFPVNVNRTDGFCPGNAWYDPADESINFCLSGGGFPNTAWTSIIHHEYGHHLVNAGGSGQGMYGEGMGDVMSTLILDDNRLGLGFFGNCNEPLRNADNNMQYPCSGEIHECGQLISGCAWATRNELILTEPSNYSDILRFLAINAILVHTGSDISPDITIDWLTLDDDDANIGNGTPHYNEIAAGFGAHNMDAPALTLVAISFPNNRPEFVSPDGDTTMRVDITPDDGLLDPSTPTLMVNTGSGFVPVPMTQLSATQFEATFPPSTCGTQIEYYIASQSDGGVDQNSPSNAPDGGTYTTNSSIGSPVVAFDDDFQTNTGWIISGSVTDGAWQRGVPVNGGRGDPTSDFDGSGQCYVTDNVAGNSDVDGGTTILTSPVLDNSNGSNTLSYALWYSNVIGVVDDSMTVEASNNNGGSWTVINTLGPDAQAGGWNEYSVNIDDVFGAPSSTVLVRFVVGDLGAGSVVEAGVDAVKLISLDCSPSECAADLNGDGSLNFFDVSAFLTAFNADDLSADFSGDGNLNFFDVSAYLVLFNAGCP